MSGAPGGVVEAVVGPVVEGVLGEVLRALGAPLERLLEALFGAVLGALLGAVLGVVLGAVWGAVLGSVLGALLGAVLGALLGALLGAVLGAVLGATPRDVLGSRLRAGPAVAVPGWALLPGALLAADALSLALLAPLVPALARLGPAGPWLEAALRLPLLTAAPRLLPPALPRGVATAAAATAAATPAAFGALRGLLGLPGPGPALLAASTPAWLGLTHAAAALALLAWAAPSARGGAPKASPKGPAAFWRVLALARSEWKVLGAAFLCLAVAAAGETAGPRVTGAVLDAVRGGAGLAGAVGAVLAAEAASVLFSGCRGWLFLLAGANLRQRLRLQLFSHLLLQDLDFFQGKPAAELSARFSAEVPLVSMAVPRGSNLLLRSLGMALVVGASMVRLAPGLALLALLELPLGITAQRLLSARRRALQRSMLEAAARTASGVQESVAAMETIRIFSAEQEEEERHGRDLEQELRLRERMELELAGFTFIHRMLELAIRVLVLFRSHQQLRDGSITPGVLVTFLLYRDTIGDHVRALLYGFNEFTTNVAAGQKIWEYLDQKPSMDMGGTLQPPQLRGHVAFQGVSFAYPGNPERPVLRDVSLELRPGEVTALAGPNGSGKSTAVALLERLRDPGSGNVLLDGIPLREYEPRYLHRQVVLVEQDPVLLSGTIRENVLLGLERCQEQELREAAAAAGALEFIQGLEHGWDTEVGELGAQLAAGQRRLLALARALLRRPTVLILDEALDEGDEGAARRWVRSGLARTVLVVSHRPRVLDGADRLVLLERGAVAAAGPPAELRDRDGGGALARLLRGRDTAAERGEE